ncbi:M12 family metallo-peptidase [Arthrobacter sp. A5]|uniref:M12 family metallo-peptidase n=1 Tax=Arthrobacter sp. A5 TaxID=576926 RepID=UPI003DA7D037
MPCPALQKEQQMHAIRQAGGLLIALTVSATLLLAPSAASADAATPPTPGTVPVEKVEGTPRSEHTFETPPSKVAKGIPGSESPDALPLDAVQGESQLSRTGDIKVKLVTVKLADQTSTQAASIPVNAATDAVNAASAYWKTMSNNRLSMSVVNTVTGFSSAATSGQSYGQIMDTVTRELNWVTQSNTALVVFIPTANLSGGALGAGWSGSASNLTGRILMPMPGQYSNNVMAHEFGHVLGLMHADSLQCGSGASDVASNGSGGFADTSCSIREYADAMDLMGFAQPDLPTISSSLWDYGSFGRGNEIFDAGVAAGTKSYTLKAWAGTDANRAVKFTDPKSGEVYYLELRLPVGYDTKLAVNGNRGVKVVQRGGATVASSLILPPNTRPFAGYYNPNLTWQAGSTFTTHAGTKVSVDSISSTSAQVRIIASPPMPQGVIDSVTVAKTGSKVSLKVRGWAIDMADTKAAIPAHVYVTAPDGTKTSFATVAGVARPDVAQVMGFGANHGYEATTVISQPGQYEVCVYAIGKNANPQLGCKTLLADGSPSPVGYVDSAVVARTGSGASLAVSGWSYDGGTPSASIPVHVYVTSPDGATKSYPFTANQAYPGVNQMFSVAGNHGFKAVVPISAAGSYRVCTYGLAVSAFSYGNSLLDCRNVLAAGAPAPVGYVDSAIVTKSVGAASIAVSGWSYDGGAPSSSIPVHVYVTSPDGATKSYPFTANQAYPGVNQVFGVAGKHGFKAVVPVSAAGDNRVCVYGLAVAPLSTGNSLLDCKTVNTGVAALTVGYLDSVSVSQTAKGATISANGWTADRDMPAASIAVHTYLSYPDGTRIGYPFVANGSRPDVNQIMGMPGNHGYSTSVNVTKEGTYKVCIYGIGISPFSLGNPEVGCKSVTYKRT